MENTAELRCAITEETLEVLHDALCMQAGDFTCEEAEQLLLLYEVHGMRERGEQLMWCHAAQDDSDNDLHKATPATVEHPHGWWGYANTEVVE